MMCLIEDPTSTSRALCLSVMAVFDDHGGRVGATRGASPHEQIIQKKLIN